MDTPSPVPDPYYYTDYQPLASKDKSYLVQLVQERLAELNYLESKSDADGDYGAKTVTALMNFQSMCGLPADGKATIETQKRLFADDAPYNTIYPHPVTAPKATESTSDNV